MVYEEIVNQARLFVLALLTGAGLLLLYDILRIFRRVVKHRMPALAIEDMIFWLFCAFWLFGFMYRQNNGIIRGFLIFGAFCGMVLYSITLSRWIVKTGTIVLKGILRGIRCVLAVLAKPFCFLGRLFGRPVRVAGRMGRKNMGRAKKRLKNILKAVRIGFNKL